MLNDAHTTALDEPLAATLTRWREEAARLDKQGLYDWLCRRVTGQTVLELGCGFGNSTAALLRHGKKVFALDQRLDCLEAARTLAPAAEYGLADIHGYDPRLLDDLQAFAPQAVVCWLAGAPAETLPRDVPAPYAVMQHRLAVQGAVLQLASRLPSVQSVHLADRTTFPWAMKDAGRQTLTTLLQKAVINDSPFTVSIADVQFHKINETLPKAALDAMPGLLPLLGEATLRRLNTKQPE